MHREAAARVGRAGVPVWGGIPLGAALLILFMVLYGDGTILAPLAGEGALAKNYLHEFFHDGRHLLGVPCN